MAVSSGNLILMSTKNNKLIAIYSKLSIGQMIEYSCFKTGENI